jgi:hypothetical protein
MNIAKNMLGQTRLSWKHVLFFLHNNAPAHSTLITQIFILQKEVTEPDHLSRSLYLIPIDFFLFPKLKMKMKVILYQPKHPKERNHHLKYAFND